jgi:hypothetical protein
MRTNANGELLAPRSMTNRERAAWFRLLEASEEAERATHQLVLAQTEFQRERERAGEQRLRPVHSVSAPSRR